MRSFELTPKRQVQDLERQLLDVRHQLEQMKSVEQYGEVRSRQETIIHDDDYPDVSRSPRRMLKARTPQDLSEARERLSDFGRGILKPPIAPSSAASSDQSTIPVQALPTREATTRYLNAYLECVHRRFPILHWPSFERNLWSFYDLYDIKQPRETVAMTLAVLGLGATFSGEEKAIETGQELMTASHQHLDFITDMIGIDQCCCTFLTGLFLAEINSKSAAYIWGGSAIRSAQDRGLHFQAGQWTTLDGEMRKRIWYSFYVWDR